MTRAGRARPPRGARRRPPRRAPTRGLPRRRPCGPRETPRRRPRRARRGCVSPPRRGTRGGRRRERFFQRETTTNRKIASRHRRVIPSSGRSDIRISAAPSSSVISLGSATFDTPSMHASFFSLSLTALCSRSPRFRSRFTAPPFPSPPWRPPRAPPSPPCRVSSPPFSAPSRRSPRSWPYCASRASPGT